MIVLGVTTLHNADNTEFDMQLAPVDIGRGIGLGQLVLSIVADAG